MGVWTEGSDSLMDEASALEAEAIRTRQVRITEKDKALAELAGQRMIARAEDTALIESILNDS